MEQTRKSSIAIGITICYFGLYIIIALSFLIKQPFGSPPDEFNRYLIPQYIARYGTLPNGFDESIRIPGYGFSYAFQPILPYIFQGWVMRVIGFFTDSEGAFVYAARSVNFILGLIMALFILLLAKKWFQKACWQWFFAFLVTFMPQSIFIHTYINTESCCMLSTVLMLYGLTCGLRDGFKWRSSLIMIIGIILCALSYYNAYGFVLSCILLFTAYYLNQSNGKYEFNWKEFFKRGGLISALVLLGIGWWFVRSYILYDGDFLGLKTRAYCASLYADNDLIPANMATWKNLGFSVWDMLARSDFFVSSQMSFIGVFGAMKVITSIWVYRFYKLLFFAGAVMCMAIPAGKVKSVDGIAAQFGKRKLFERFFHWNMLFCVVMPLFLSIQYSYATDFQPQGRYLLPALVPLAYYCVRGIEKTLALIQVLLSKKGVEMYQWQILEQVFTGIVCIVIAVCLIVTVYGYVFVYYETNPMG